MKVAFSRQPRRLEIIAKRIRMRHGLSGPTAKALAEIHFNQKRAK